MVSELLERAELAPGMFGGQVRTHEDGMIMETLKRCSFPVKILKGQFENRSWIPIIPTLHTIAVRYLSITPFQEAFQCAFSVAVCEAIPQPKFSCEGWTVKLNKSGGIYSWGS